MAPYFLTVRLPYVLLGAEAACDPDRVLEPDATHEKTRRVFYEVDSQVVAEELLDVFRCGRPRPGIPGDLLSPVGSLERLRNLAEGVSEPIFELVNGADLDLPQRVICRQEVAQLRKLLSYPDWDPDTTGFVVSVRHRFLAARYRQAQEMEALIRHELRVGEKTDESPGEADESPSGIDKPWENDLADCRRMAELLTNMETTMLSHGVPALTKALGKDLDEDEREEYYALDVEIPLRYPAGITTETMGDFSKRVFCLAERHLGDHRPIKMPLDVFRFWEQGTRSLELITRFRAAKADAASFIERLMIRIQADVDAPAGKQAPTAQTPTKDDQGAKQQDEPAGVTRKATTTDPERMVKMGPQKGEHEEEEDFEGWAALKESLLGDDALSPEDGIVLGPVLREASGAEVASRLDALVRHFRDVSSAYRLARLTSGEGDGLYDSNSYANLMIPANQLLRTWFGAFNCLREAEGWFYRGYGPPRDTELLDEIADSLGTLEDGIDTMRCFPVDWEYVDEQDESIAEALTHLHGTARGIREKCETGESQTQEDQKLREETAQQAGRPTGSGDTHPEADSKQAQKWRSWLKAQRGKGNHTASYVQYAKEENLDAKVVERAVDRDRKRKSAAKAKRRPK